MNNVVGAKGIVSSSTAVFATNNLQSTHEQISQDCHDCHGVSLILSKTILVVVSWLS